MTKEQARETALAARQQFRNNAQVMAHTSCIIYPENGEWFPAGLFSIYNSRPDGWEFAYETKGDIS